MTDFTIITPSYNQGSFISGFFESYRTLTRSSYKSQLILIDNCSTDNTDAIIKENLDLIDVLIVEPDNGQSSAINKAIPFIKGRFVNWINTDDRLTQEALTIVGKIYDENPIIQIVAGRCSKEFPAPTQSVDRLTTLGHPSCLPISLILGQVIQPSTFWRTDAFLDFCPINTSLHYVMDHDLLLRYLLANGSARIAYTDCILAKALLHENCKSIKASNSFTSEYRALYSRLYNEMRSENLPLHESYDTSALTILFSQAEEIINLSRFFRRMPFLGIPYPSKPALALIGNPLLLHKYFAIVRPAMHWLNSL